ncbi:FitA-like ribbon-helix-helix domain-containing protein [Brooklawnia cerclae]
MAVLTVRNVPDEVHRALRVQAAEHGRSTEAEVREICGDGCRRSCRRAASADGGRIDRG